MRERRGGTVTFVFTDIEGSTKLVKQLRERWPEVRAAHRRIVREAFEAHGGDEVDTQGDSFFYVFGLARDAALAAADAQRALAAHEWPEDGVVRIRIGMHTGEPVVSEEGYHGIGVHRAARIMAAAHGEQVLLSEATAAVLRDEEVAGVGVRDLGVHRLKDLDRPEHVYQLVPDGAAASFPKIRTAGEWRPFYRRPLVIGATAGVLAAAVAVPVFTFAGGSGGGQRLAGVDENAVAVVDTDGIQAETPDVPSPESVTVGAGAIWVTSGSNGLVRIDPQMHRVLQRITVGNGPQGVAFAQGAVWVANSLDGTVSRVSPDTNAEVAHYAVGNTPTGVAAGAGSVWVTNASDGTITQLTRFDATSGPVERTIDAGSPVSGIAYGGRALWVSDPVGNAVVRIPVGSTSPSARISVGSGPGAIAYGTGAVWVANTLDGTVSRIDPARNAVSATVPVGASPNGIAVTPTAVWVSDEADATLARVDPNTGAVKRSTIGGRPEGVAASGVSVWVAVQAAGQAHRGGTLRIRIADIDSLDPAFAYYGPTWGVISIVSDGLVGFKRVGGIAGNTLVPDLATSLPQPTDGGRTYAFQLRSGIRFSSGEPLEASDVRATFERLFRATEKDFNGQLIHSPRLDFYGGIIGAAACGKHPAMCDLSRGIVTDDAARTVTFHLTAPDPEFLYKLALPFGSIVPKGTASGRERSVVGTGPYMVRGYTPFRRARLVRNPRFHVWSKAAQPPGVPDTIDVVGAPPHGADAFDAAGFKAVVNGTADWGSFLPRLDVGVARTQYPAQLHITPQPVTNVVVFNLHRGPFRNVHARRAVAYALDRAALVDYAGGSDVAAVTCQVLPPNFPGYKPYCPYTTASGRGVWTAPDLERARQQLTLSGTRGARVRLYVMTSDEPFARAIRLIEGTLRQLGYRVSTKAFPSLNEYFPALYTQTNGTDVGVTAWAQDYPTPSNFFTGLLGCGNAAYACTPALDRHMAALTQRGSDKAWAAFDRYVVDTALLVPFTNIKATDFVSKRLGNYQHHPIFGLLYDQAWVR
jgi:YVTN family beta-propeller protein